MPLLFKLVSGVCDGNTGCPSGWKARAWWGGNMRRRTHAWTSAWSWGSLIVTYARWGKLHLRGHTHQRLLDVVMRSVGRTSDPAMQGDARCRRQAGHLWLHAWTEWKERSRHVGGSDGIQRTQTHTHRQYYSDVTAISHVLDTHDHWN
jgi:hypothetical protein